ncbi:hypothetical protein HMPREF3113_06520 [Stenotrophomonas sp. HMSC10F06]|nr:hypothetical protein HMPREF3113_06520 [Stenotrophomonas sp. HMSC10F06]
MAAANLRGDYQTFQLISNRQSARNQFLAPWRDPAFSAGLHSFYHDRRVINQEIFNSSDSIALSQ